MKTADTRDRWCIETVDVGFPNAAKSNYLIIMDYIASAWMEPI